MSSLYCHAQPDDYEQPSVVKVVLDQNSDALYFSRSRIPYPRETTEVPVLRHIGLYVFRRELLLQFAEWEPTPLERTEMLEQLRVLEHGYKIRMVYFEHPSIAVDTETDLQRVRAILASEGST